MVCDSSFRPHDARLGISETRPLMVFVTVGALGLLCVTLAGAQRPAG